jgi:hypothetical protein
MKVLFVRISMPEHICSFLATQLFTRRNLNQKFDPDFYILKGDIWPTAKWQMCRLPPRCGWGHRPSRTGSSSRNVRKQLSTKRNTYEQRRYSLSDIWERLVNSSVRISIPPPPFFIKQPWIFEISVSHSGFAGYSRTLGRYGLSVGIYLLSGGIVVGRIGFNKAA